MSERRALATVLAANAISLLGNVMAAVAIPWFVLVETGSALQAREAEAGILGDRGGADEVRRPVLLAAQGVPEVSHR